MPTMRTPLNRASKSKITPAALDAFRQMLTYQQQCRCMPHASRRCTACQKRFEQELTIAREFRLAPWQFPPVAHPAEASPYPADGKTAGAINWPLAQERYRALVEVAGIAIDEDA